MAVAVFGPGIIILTRTDISPSTPINVGFAQELSLDIAGETKQLYGQNQFPLVVARGTIKADGKIKAAEISSIAWNSTFYGMAAFTAGGYQWNVAEGHTIGPGGLVTVNQTGFDDDLGVVYASGGLANLPSQKVGTSPTTGHYSLNTGGSIYLFGDAPGTSVNVTYTSSTTVGQSLLVTSQPIGTTPTFQLDYYTNLNQPTSLPFAVRIYACVASKHTMDFKLTDFMIPELDFEFFALPNQNVLNYVFPQVS